MKYLTVVIIFIFYLIGFVVADDDDSAVIQCYQCVHVEKYYEIEPSCRNSPNYGLSSSCIRSDIDDYGDGIETCVKVTAVVDGMPMVGRGCMTVPLHAFDRLNGKCADYFYVPMPIPLSDRNATNANICYCSEDSCNSAKTVSHLPYSCITLLAFAVHRWYGFVSNQ